MWLFSHDRAHTVKLQAHRGINQTAACPFGCVQEEDAMRLLRDCINAKDHWLFVVNPSVWSNFSSKYGADWVKWNLKHEAGREFTKKISSATLFGYVCWDIWISQCNKLFDSEYANEPANIYNTLFKARADQDLLRKCEFYGYHTSQDREECNTRTGFVKMKVDSIAKWK